MKHKVPDKIPDVNYKRILYATDLSESGRFAFHHAAGIAKKFGSELTVIHVVEGGPGMDRRLFGYIDEELWEEIKTRNLQEAMDILVSRKRDNAAIKECVGQFCDEAKEGMPGRSDIEYNIEVRMGDPVEMIVEAAENGSYDLIVMARHGGRAVKTAVLGDTVRRVIRNTDIPVLIIRVPEDD
ncbi:MAG: universal stress protein [Nitrospirota bacterium]|nr:MAG: universal stress protein [Nitrospirota bacterium]